MSFYCYDNHRGAAQLEDMRQLDRNGICLFCPDGFRYHRRNRLLWRTEYWSIARNEFPYSGTEQHILISPIAHAEDLLDLDDTVLADFWAALRSVRECFSLKHYGLGARNGDCRFTGATIKHVHCHVLVAPESPDVGTEPIRMRFSSHPAGLRRPEHR